ncbi:hypothetical protein BC827DRAFT_235318 [Russula dissimulans]|nr:hypothetical protein BC827DRAFT_235318 [Russula dissimulans]
MVDHFKDRGYHHDISELSRVILFLLSALRSVVTFALVAYERPRRSQSLCCTRIEVILILLLCISSVHDYGLKCHGFRALKKDSYHFKRWFLSDWSIAYLKQITSYGIKQTCQPRGNYSLRPTIPIRSFRVPSTRLVQGRVTLCTKFATALQGFPYQDSHSRRGVIVRMSLSPRPQGSGTGPH